MSEHDFGQRVMAAAGVCGRKPICMCDGQECRSACRGNDQIEYPDPLTPSGFCALWDALEAKGYKPTIRSVSDGYVVNLYRYDARTIPDICAQAGHEDRAQALLEAAGQALGVSRG